MSLCLTLQSMDSSDLSDGAVTLQEYLELKKALATSEAKVQQLMKVNSSLSDELRRLQREVGAAALVGGGGSQRPAWRTPCPRRWGCCPESPEVLTPCALSDPQAAGRELADPAAAGAGARSPAAQRAGRTHIDGAWRECPPQGPPGLLHV